MQTVNFKCGHCGNLMGVSLEHLGQPVRCPTCQQVVLAPARPADETNPPFQTSLESAAAAREDIFSPSSEAEDALFGGAEGPKFELTPSPSLPLPSHAEPLSPTLTPSSFPELPPAGHVNGEMGRAAAAASQEHVGPVEPPGWAPVNGGPVTPEGAPEGELSASPSTRRREPGRVNWMLPLVVLPLAIWAVGATVAAIWGWTELVKANKRPSLFEQFPDVEGDTPGVRKGKATSRLNWDKATASQELPAHLRVPLGGVLTVGDLEVRPLRVERKKVAVHSEGEDEAQPLHHEALVLTLRLKNLSDDSSFTPLDNYFDRRWEGAGPPPLTMLQAGTMSFWGGSHDWAPLGAPRRRPREWLSGPGRKNVDPEGLAPGASAEVVIATNGDDAEVQRYLFGLDGEGRPGGKPYEGKLLWRVQLRRGEVTWRGRPRAACAVVGVELSSSDYLAKTD